MESKSSWTFSMIIAHIHVVIWEELKSVTSTRPCLQMFFDISEKLSAVNIVILGNLETACCTLKLLICLFQPGVSDEEWYHCAFTTYLLTKSSSWSLVHVIRNESCHEGTQVSLSKWGERGYNSGIYRGHKKWIAGLFLAVVWPLAEMCDSGRELLWRQCAVIKPATMTSNIIWTKDQELFDSTLYYCIRSLTIKLHMNYSTIVQSIKASIRWCKCLTFLNSSLE